MSTTEARSNDPSGIASADALRDMIQPFPTFSELYVDALNGLRAAPAAERRSPPKWARITLMKSSGGGPHGGLPPIGPLARLRRPLEELWPLRPPIRAQREPELAGQTVVVIGGSSGIGLETARRAARREPT